MTAGSVLQNTRMKKVSIHHDVIKLRVLTYPSMDCRAVWASVRPCSTWSRAAAGAFWPVKIAPAMVLIPAPALESPDLAVVTASAAVASLNIVIRVRGTMIQCEDSLRRADLANIVVGSGERTDNSQTGNIAGEIADLSSFNDGGCVTLVSRDS